MPRPLPWRSQNVRRWRWGLSQRRKRRHCLEQERRVAFPVGDFADEFHDVPHVLLVGGDVQDEQIRETQMCLINFPRYGFSVLKNFSQIARLMKVPSNYRLAVSVGFDRKESIALPVLR